MFISESIYTAIYALIAAFGVCVVLCPLIIPMLRRFKAGQPIRSDGPQTHLTKAGTPTMGGIVIVLSLAVAGCVFGSGSSDALAVIVITVLFGLIGFIDDYLKVINKSSDGLSAAAKLAAQCVVSTGLIVYLFRNGYDSGLYAIFVPFTNTYVDIGFLTIPFMFFCIIGFVNGVNLTDGLDGLAGGVTALVVTFIFFIAAAADSALTTVSGAAVGALLGFLLFNSHPARVFMGDTGSLALGGFLASLAIILKIPLVIVIVGFVYFIESVSVLIQTGFFKITRHIYGKGRRVFKMAPFHHHLEKGNMPETRIVALFYIITAVLCVVGFLGTQQYNGGR